MRAGIAMSFLVGMLWAAPAVWAQEEPDAAQQKATAEELAALWH